MAKKPRGAATPRAPKKTSRKKDAAKTYRNPDGTFQKGNPGGPGGPRPGAGRKPDELKSMLREALLKPHDKNEGIEAVANRLREIAFGAEDDDTALRAAVKILEYSVGRPQVSVDLSGRVDLSRVALDDALAAEGIGAINNDQ